MSDQGSLFSLPDEADIELDDLVGHIKDLRGRIKRLREDGVNASMELALCEAELEHKSSVK